MVCYTFGLLRGSKMGPLLFNIFLADFLFMLKDIDIKILQMTMHFLFLQKL